MEGSWFIFLAFFVPLFQAVEPVTSRAGICYVNFTVDHFHAHHGPETRTLLDSVCLEKGVDALFCVFESATSP